MKKILALLFMTVVSAFVLTSCTSSDIVTPEKAKENLEQYIQTKGFQGVEVKEVTRDDNFYRVKIVDSGRETELYMTKDGKELLQPMFNIDPEAAKEEQAQQDQAYQDQLAALPKSDKPTVDLFVMSHCPYGTQMEKAVIPAVEALGDKIDFNLRFVDYAMHPDQGEVEEQLNQYCIQEEQNDKLLTYLKCFLQEGDSETCLGEVGINVNQMNACANRVDQELQITAKKEDETQWDNPNFPPFDVDKELNEKYGVQGSPHLVINEASLEGAKRTPQGVLEAICSTFNQQPDECQTELSTQTPNPGFGSGTSNSNATSDASCN